MDSEDSALVPSRPALPAQSPDAASPAPVSEGRRPSPSGGLCPRKLLRPPVFPTFHLRPLPGISSRLASPAATESRASGVCNSGFESQLRAWRESFNFPHLGTGLKQLPAHRTAVKSNPMLGQDPVRPALPAASRPARNTPSPGLSQWTLVVVTELAPRWHHSSPCHLHLAPTRLPGCQQPLCSGPQWWGPNVRLLFPEEQKPKWRSECIVTQ